MERLLFLARERGNILVETWNGHAKIVVVKLGDHFGQNRDGVGNGAAKDSGVQVLRRSGNLQLVIVQTPEAIGDRRNAFGQHGGIRDNERVRLEALAILLHEIPQANAADFLFALDHDFHVDGEFARCLPQRLEGFQVDVDLPFVVGGAATVEIFSADGRLERGSSPQIERLGGLHVVMSVNQHRGLARRLKGFAVHEGMYLGWNHFHAIQARSAELLGDPSGGALDIGPVLGLRADAGNAEQPLQLFQMLGLLRFDVLDQAHSGLL